MHFTVMHIIYRFLWIRIPTDYEYIIVPVIKLNLHIVGIKIFDFG
jgi:hypothetical protein